MRPIDADICIAKIKNLPITYDAETVQRCIEVLSNEPTVDAVQVIRCKDCVMYAEGKRSDGHWCRGRKVKRDSYCDLAERKEK